jgi:protein-disulfide isomerase
VSDETKEPESDDVDETDEPAGDEQERDSRPDSEPPSEDRREKASDPPASSRPSPAASGASRRSVLQALLAGLVVGGGAGFGAGYAVYGRRRGGRRKRKPMKPAYIPVSAHNPRKGPDPAKVVIVEFSEFECPFCGRVLPTLDKIRQKYPDDVAIVFKNNPLPFHDRATPAAAAFLAASRQNKAWEMHDLLFKNRKALSDADLESYAEQIGLDLAKFKEDLSDPKIAEQIAADKAEAKAAGATGTPAFFINGRPLRGAKPFEAFVEIIEEELKKADELIAAGTPVAEVYAKRAKDLAAAAPAGKKD